MQYVLKKSFHYLLLIVLVSSCGTNRTFYPTGDLQVIDRQQWGSATPVLPMRKHTIRRITIHHTAVRQNFKRSIQDKLKGLQKFSMEKSSLSDGRIKEPWADIPYHFYIAVDGLIGEARELKYVGDSNTPYDPTGHALIVLEGNFNEEELTGAQNRSLQQLVIALAKQFKVPADKISGHKDHAETACPGNNLYNLIPSLRDVVNQ